MLLTCELGVTYRFFGFWTAITRVCIHILNFELNLCGVAERKLSVIVIGCVFAMFPSELKNNIDEISKLNYDESCYSKTGRKE